MSRSEGTCLAKSRAFAPGARLNSIVRDGPKLHHKGIFIMIPVSRLVLPIDQAKGKVNRFVARSSVTPQPCDRRYMKLHQTHLIAPLPEEAH